MRERTPAFGESGLITPLMKNGSKVRDYPMVFSRVGWDEGTSEFDEHIGMGERVDNWWILACPVTLDI